MLSDGAIYSSIDFTTKSNYNSSGQTSQATPYATTQILHSSSIHELAVDLPEAQWKASLQAKQEMTNLGYSLPDKNSCNNSKSDWSDKLLWQKKQKHFYKGKVLTVLWEISKCL